MSDQGISKGERRRAGIMTLLKQQGKVSIPEIIERFECSEATARRDLDLLEKQGNIIRTLGGAQLDTTLTSGETSFNEKRNLLWLEKEAIAAKAASMVEKGDIVGLTGGTTTFLIARALKFHNDITVVTNAVNIAMELADSDGVQVVLTGGVMRNKSFELCGPLAESIVNNIHIGKMFMGIDGISIDPGVTTFSELEAQIARLMLSRASQCYAVFDHTKIDKISLFAIAPLTEFKGFVTNRLESPAMLDYIEKHRMELHLTEPATEAEKAH
ncbi:DeoR/GlpR family DNA-binding transcription regulator [Paenibacillus allorhizosphaerae]